MRHSFTAILSTFLVVACSDNTTADMTSVIALKESGLKADTDEEEDTGNDEEEITAIPPTIISGSHLVCNLVSEKNQQQTSELICYLEKDGQIILTPELDEEDFIAKTEEGERLNIHVHINPDKTFSIIISTTDSQDFIISLENYEEQIEPATIKQEQGNLDPTSKSDELHLEESYSSEQEESQVPLSIEPDGNSYCAELSEHGSWAHVPADPFYGTSDFCIMKFEAKLEAEKLTSVASGLPWTSASQEEAREACLALGQGFHLITNPEWMAVATNAMNVGSNWSGNEVGNGALARGHSFNDFDYPCEANEDDSFAFSAVDCISNATGDFRKKRTHLLSSGDIIWDLAGNVWEWVDYTLEEDRPSPRGNVWVPFPEVIESESMPLTDLIPLAAIDQGWSSTQSLGMYNAGDETRSGTMKRGGGWNALISAGLFGTYLVKESNAPISFRCTYTQP